MTRCVWVSLLLASALSSMACAAAPADSPSETESTDTGANDTATKDADTGDGDSDGDTGDGDSEAGDGDGDGDDGGQEPGSCQDKLAGPVNALGFPAACNPREAAEEPGYQCCSDDPTMLDGLTPFSNNYNNLSSHGQCVEGSVPGALENGCPIPCNPKWSVTQTESVCGSSDVAICCQTQQLTPRDCIYDVGLACFRPAVGLDTADVQNCPTSDLEAGLSAAGYDTALARCNSDWSTTAHDTHQDPGANSASSSFNQFLDLGIDFWSCVNSLTVADQRGFCLPKSQTVQVCPGALPDYIDACEQMNLDLGYTCN